MPVRRTGWSVLKPAQPSLSGQCQNGGYTNKATAIWNDCHAGKLANTALGGVEREEHPAGNKPPPSGVLLGGLSKYPRAGAVPLIPSLAVQDLVKGDLRHSYP